jgi:GH15 family glucan-1,4-alpha-glucosidase
MRYYDELARFEREGFDVIVDKTWEEISLRDCFDDTCYDIRDMEDKVNSGFYDWFMLRVRVLVEGHELGSAYLGGCLYEDAREVLSDGTAEDQIFMAIEEARKEVYPLMRKLQAINEETERQGVCV